MIKTYDAGAILWKLGEIPPAPLMIRDGRVQLHGADGAVLRSALAGEMIGLGEFLANKPSRVTATCEEPVKLELLDSDELHRRVSDDPVLKSLLDDLAVRAESHAHQGSAQGSAPDATEVLRQLAEAVKSLGAGGQGKRPSTGSGIMTREEYDAGSIESFYHQREHLTQELITELSDLGAIMPFMEDETITDILINGTSTIYVERNGKLTDTGVHIGRETEVLSIADKIVRSCGRQINPYRPLIDARLLDGSRVNIIAPPLAVDGTIISIRKFAKRAITLDQMVEQDNITAQLAEFLRIIGKCRINIVISGGTGSGKTTLLNAISQHISPDERIITIEDAAELRLQQPHVVRLETQPIMAGRGNDDIVSTRDLVKNALRMRPDRIIVGEVRGEEAFDMMQAMNTGHDGSLTTVHANHPRDALSRMENMIGMSSIQIPTKAMRFQIASALHLIVQISRMRDGKRRINFVSEIVGMEGDIITMNDLFTYSQTGEGKDGELIGGQKWMGVMPRFGRRLAYYGELQNLERALGTKVMG